MFAESPIVHKRFKWHLGGTYVWNSAVTGTKGCQSVVQCSNKKYQHVIGSGFFSHVEGKCVRTSLSSAGGEWEQYSTGRLPGGSVWSNVAVAHCWRPLPHSHAKAPGGTQAGDQCSAPPVPCGSQYPRLPQHAPESCPFISGRQAALGVLGVRSRARLPQLGPPFGDGGQHWARVSHVPGGGALRATVAGLRAGLLRGHRCTHIRLRAMRTCVFREVGQVLVRDPSAPRHSRLPRSLPLLRHPTWPNSGLFQANLPGSGGLSLRGLALAEEIKQECWHAVKDYFVLSFIYVSQLWNEASLFQVLVMYCGLTIESHYRLFGAFCGCLDGHCRIQRCEAHWTTDARLLQN